MKEKYIKRKINSVVFKKYFEALKAEVGSKKVIIYGANDIFEELNKKDFFSGLNIVAVCDNKKTLKTLHGFRFITPDKIKELNADFILVLKENFNNVKKILKEELFFDENIRVEHLFKELFAQESKLMPYLEKINFEKRLTQLSKKLKDKTVVIYGTGIIFEIINAYYNLGKLNIIGISDMKFQKYPTAEFLGYKTVEPADIVELSPDYVLISTIYVKDILENLRYSILEDTEIKVMPLIKEPKFSLKQLFERI